MRIAIVKLSSLGDIVHSMIVLQFIKKYNQEILIDWFVDESYKELLEYHPDINKVHLVKIKQAKKHKSLFLLTKEFKKVRKLPSYDIVIDMQGLIKSAIIACIIPSKITLGFDKNSIRERIASIFYNKKFAYSYYKNIIERNFELIKFALEMPINKEVIHDKTPFLFPKNKYDVFNISSTKKNVILIPGASHVSKRYSPENFSKLTNLLDVNYLIIWGSREEKIIAEKIKKLSPKVNLCDKLTINSLISLISQVDLVIGPDTGPTHIAWALNISSITLFGPTPGYRNTFISKNNIIVESSSKVNPKKINKNDCSINDIEPKSIYRLAETLISCDFNPELYLEIDELS
ncbi:lipopolysaccharide heptosyltransferase I [bacterium]|nr:lipopolysaccharide heptosyltransferase I [bacterium]